MCKAVEAYGCYEERASSYNISKWRDYGKDYNEYLCQCR